MVVDDALAGARLLTQLPGFLRRPISLAEAQSAIQTRLQRRADDFLALARQAIYDQAGSPYRRLLGLAGCEHGDLQHLVELDGLEGALAALYRQGVYLTVDEFKGCRAVTRGSTSFWVDQRAVRNPLARAHLEAQTGGSRGERMTVPIDLAFIRERAVNLRLIVDARGAGQWQVAHWGSPSGGVMCHLLEYCGAGLLPRRWFLQIKISGTGLQPRYSWGPRLLRWGAALAGKSFPAPSYVPLRHPRPIVDWMQASLRAGEIPYLITFPSSAAWLCQYVLEAGGDLAGAQLLVASEPLTPARRATIERAGATAYPRYLSTECGLIGYGCLEPRGSDDLHLFHDLVALIQAGPERASGGLPPRALLVTSLRATAPLTLVNVSLGDQADIERRECGCPLEGAGWPIHLSNVRSFEKLTAGGMTFLDTDVIRVLEEVLPTRFGGGPTDYQLAEQEGREGQPDLKLLVDPRLGQLDEPAVIEAFLTAIGRGSGVSRVMELQWREGDLLRVERRPPGATASGKILHLHLDRTPERRAAARSTTV